MRFSKSGVQIQFMVPHPIPYQGSKRRLAETILAEVKGRHFKIMYEPFCGSAAVTLAAAQQDIAEEYVLADSLVPLVDIWRQIIRQPLELSEEYNNIWQGQMTDEEHYNNIRAQFNQDNDPAKLLYLLARCVKNAARFNSLGQFNQSPDKRRKGTQPDKMRRNILAAHYLLSGRCRAVAGDFKDILVKATASDFVYLDPPYEGTSTGKDHRYHQNIERHEIIVLLRDLNQRKIPFVLSYDGQTGQKTYGEPLPDDIGRRIMVPAGRSSQSTLHGRKEETLESLYLSPLL